jgi:hypothetical protein
VVQDAAIAAWKAEPRATRGGQPRYSELAITTALTLRAVFRLALRQTEGLIGSIVNLLGLDLAVPDHSTLSRRAETLEVPRGQPGTRPIHLLVDSTGLRLCGPGEWLVEKHGSRARRSWRKLHIGVDADTVRIVASALTTNDVNDASQIGPLLDQVAGPIASFTADGAYDQDGVYRDVAARHPEAAVVGAERHGRDGPNPAGPTSSDHRGAWTHGLVEGIWLQLACPGRGRYHALQARNRRRSPFTHRRAPCVRGGHRRPRAQPNARTRSAGVCPHHVNADQPGAYCACKAVHATQSPEVEGSERGKTPPQPRDGAGQPAHL